MKEYLDFLNSRDDANELNAPMLLVEEFGIEGRIAVSITNEWIRLKQEDARNADRHD